MRMTKRAWSVELESNAWQDDAFNCTVNECIRYCQERNITIDGINARLAEVEIDNDGCITYCFNIVNSLDELDYPR